MVIDRALFQVPFAQYVCVCHHYKISPLAAFPLMPCKKHFTHCSDTHIHIYINTDSVPCYCRKGDVIAFSSGSPPIAASPSALQQGLPL